MTPIHPPPGLWDSFWAEHASRSNLFHRLLWLARFLFSKEYARHLAEFAGPLSSPSLLEVGCGSARTLHYLEKRLRPQQCFAFDLSPQAVQLARAINPNFLPAVADALSLPLPDSSLDMSFSIGLIEHFSRQQAEQMMHEKTRITRPGGVVAVMVPWKNSAYNLLVRRAFGKSWPFGDEYPFRRAELSNMLKTVGLKQVEIFVIYGSTLLGAGRKLSL